MKWQNKPLDELLDQLRGTWSVADYKDAITLPPEAYRSSELFNLECVRVLRSGWQCVCRIDHLDGPGSYYSVDLLGSRLVVTSEESGDLHVLSRTCRHRWMDVATGAGRARSLQCPYHHWTYALDGTLLSAPLMTDAHDFDKSDFCLPEVRHEVWHGFVFVNLDGNASELTPQLAPLEALLANYDIDGYQSVNVSHWNGEWNWKIMVENFLECYHHLGAHADSLGKEFPASASRSDIGGEVFSVVRADRDPKLREHAAQRVPGSKRLTASQREELVILAVFPHFIMSIGPGSLVWLRIQPDGPGRIGLQLDICLSGAAAADPNSQAIQDEIVAEVMAVHQEDLEVCATVQLGANSEEAMMGRLAPIERPLWEFYRFIGRKLDPADPLTTETMV